MSHRIADVADAQLIGNPVPGRAPRPRYQPRPLRWTCGCVSVFAERFRDGEPLLSLQHACVHHDGDQAGMLAWVLEECSLTGRVTPFVEHPKPAEGPVHLPARERERRLDLIDGNRLPLHRLRDLALHGYRQPRRWTLPAGWDPGAAEPETLQSMGAPQSAPPVARLFGLPVRFAGDVIRLHLDHSATGRDSLTSTPDPHPPHAYGWSTCPTPDEALPGDEWTCPEPTCGRVFFAMDDDCSEGTFKWELSKDRDPSPDPDQETS